MKPRAILETVLYAEDLNAAKNFYEGILGLECFGEDEGRDVFFYCGEQTLLIFNPKRTSIKRAQANVAPAHGAIGQGHMCFAASPVEISDWRSYLESRGVTIEADFRWPNGARSIYFRDPAGNCLEFGEPRMWGLPRPKLSLRGQRVVIATHNKGKLEEFSELLRPLGVSAVSAAELGIPEPAETEESFAGNARIKSLNAMKACGLVAIADDSGLCVEALGGDPGVHTADWAGPSRDFAMAMRLVEEKLQAKGALEPQERKATFVCVLSVSWPDGAERLYEGRVDGHLVWPPRGKLGHGYDPVFVPGGQGKSFAEMTHGEKNKLSHRSRALEKLARDLF